MSLLFGPYFGSKYPLTGFSGGGHSGMSVETVEISNGDKYEKYSKIYTHLFSWHIAHYTEGFLNQFLFITPEVGQSHFLTAS